MMKRIALLLFSVFLLLFPAKAEKISFTHLTMQNGLSHNQINCIVKDDEGFVWLSTAWGLNRFDGYNFRVFAEHEGDSTALVHNYVMGLQTLGNGRLLVESLGGYQIFDSHTEKFVKVSKLFAAAGGEGLIERIYVDRKHQMWITLLGQGAVCHCLAPDGRQLRSYDLRAAAGSRDVKITAMAHDCNCMAVVFSNGAMVRFDPEKGAAEVQRICSMLPAGQHHLVVDSQGNYWVWRDNEPDLWLRESGSGRWICCTSAADSFLRIPTKQITSLAEDKEGRIWIATNHGGVGVIDLSKRSTTLLAQDRQNERTLLSNSVNNVYVDNDGVVWLGYYKSGVSIFDESIFKFEKDVLPQLGVDFTPDINTIEEGRDGTLWLGTNGNGLVHLDQRTGRAQLFRYSPTDPFSLPSDIVVTVFAASDGNVWIGTFLGGLARYDGKRFYRYKDCTDVSPAMAGDNIWAIAEDNNHNLWIGSLEHGLAKLNLLTGEEEVYNVENGRLTSDHIMSIDITDDQRILLGTSNGAAVITPPSMKAQLLCADDSKPCYDGYVSEIFEDSRGLVWIGTRRGLFVIDVHNHRQHSLSIENGLENEVVSAIAEDDSHNVWITTAQGVSKISVEINPRYGETSFAVSNYTEPDGILTMGYNIHAIEKTSHGRIYMGGCYGLNSFVPGQMKYNTQVPEVHFVGLDVFGQKVEIGSQQDGANILPQAMQYMRELQLTHEHNMFRIYFSTLSYVLPQKVQFSYCLEGFSNQWFTTNEPYANFTNLAPGNYTLRVRATNCDGVSSEQVSSLAIIILPPWWQTAWAYAAYVVILAAAIAYGIWLLRRKERDRFRMQQIEVEIERQRELDLAKQKFFTNVSHELRTPLSLIITPLETLMEKSTSEEIMNKLNLIHRNAIRLLNVVNQLLDFRKNVAGSMQLNLSDGDLVDFVKRTASNFQSISEHDVRFSVIAAVNQIMTRFDADKIDKVVQNLLSNAFKYTPEGGVVVLWVGLADNGYEAQIRVSDTGIGIPAEYKDQIFNRFFQVPRTEGLYGGSGIGLHLVKEYVQLHNGRIQVSDNENGGTVFVVSLPLAATNELADSALPCEKDETLPADSRKTILIVDDNTDFRLLLSEALAPEYNVCQARNGREALDVAFASLPDLIVCDIMMPLMDGNTFCKRVKNDVRTSHIPLIMLSSKDASEHTSEFLSYGADEYMAKPFNASVLKLKIAKLLELGKLRQEKFSHLIDPTPSEITITPIDEELIARAIRVCENNIEQKDFKVEDLSSELGMSRITLYKKLVAITGHTPIEFIRIIRLKRAAQMLCDKRQDIASIAYALGFSDRRYFSNYFKELFGVSPQEYRDQGSDIEIKTDLLSVNPTREKE